MGVPKLLDAEAVASGDADQLSLVAYTGKLRNSLVDEDSLAAKAKFEADRAAAEAARQAAEAAKAAEEKEKAAAAAATAKAEAERLAAEKAAAKAAAEAKAEAERAAAEVKADAERLAKEKAAAAEKAAAEKLKAEMEAKDREAAERAAAEQAAKDKAEAERKAKEAAKEMERAAKEKEAAEQLAREKAAAEKEKTERAAAMAKAASRAKEAARLKRQLSLAAAEQAKAELGAKAKAEAEAEAAAQKEEAEKAAQQRMLSEKAAEEELLAAEALARERQEAEGVAREAEAAERAAAARAAAEKAAAETAEKEREAAEAAAEVAAAEVAAEAKRSAAETEAAEAAQGVQAELARVALEEAKREKVLADQKAAIEQAAAEKAANEAAEADRQAAEAEAAEQAAIVLSEDMARAAQRAARAAAAKRRVSIEAAEQAVGFLEAFATAAALEEKEAETMDISDSNATASNTNLAAKRRASSLAREAVDTAKRNKAIELETAASFIDFYPTFFEEEVESERSLDEAFEPRIPVHFVAPAPAQSEEATEEMVTVAAAVTATAAAPSKPIVVPEGYAAGAIVIDKKELSTKLGIALSNAEDKEHPVVCTIGDDGAAATPSCQLQGKLEAGDRVLSIEAATNVVRVETEVDCKNSASTCTAFIKRCVHDIKFGVLCDGSTKTVVVHKGAQASQLGLLLETCPRWKHPRVSSLTAGSPCEGKLAVGDIITSIEAATAMAKLETHHAAAKHTVASGFLKAAIGPITIHVHRLKDQGKRRASVATVKPQDMATTDAMPVLPAIVTAAASLRESERRSTKVFSAETVVDHAEAADFLAGEAPVAQRTASSFIDFYPTFFESGRVPSHGGSVHFLVPAPEQSEEATEEVKVVDAAVKATVEAAPTTVHIAVPVEYAAEAIVIDKKELFTKLGITLSNTEGTAYPVVVDVAKDGAAATPACQLQGKLEAGDRIIAVAGPRHVVRIETAVDSNARSTKALMKKCVCDVKFGILRKGEAMEVRARKPTPTSPLGVTVESSTAWKHPKIGAVDADCPCTGQLREGDVITSVEGAVEMARVETRHAEAAHTVATAFIKASIGPVSIHLHRLKDQGKRRASVTAVKAEIKEEGLDVATTDSAPVLPAMLTDAVPKRKSERRSASIFSAESAALEVQAAEHLAAPVRVASSFIDFYPTFFEPNPDDAPLQTTVTYVAPAPAQSEEATEEMVTVAAAVTATAAAPSKPIVVPEGYAAGAIVIDKKELSTKLGIALSNAEDKEHPVVCTIGDDGAAATPSCQLQGKLEAGDRVLSIEAATNVVRVETEVDCKNSASTCTAFIKRCVHDIKFGVLCDGSTKTVVVHKGAQASQLGLLLETCPRWKHPRVSSLTAGSPCEGKLAVGDIITSIEAATAMAKLETHHAAAKHMVASGFLKAAVGPITIHVHRLKDQGKRQASVAALQSSAATDPEVAETDSDPIVPSVITRVAPPRQSARRVTKVLFAESAPPPQPTKTASSFVDFFPTFFEEDAPPSTIAKQPSAALKRQPSLLVQQPPARKQSSLSQATAPERQPSLLKKGSSFVAKPDATVAAAVALTAAAATTPVQNQPTATATGVTTRETLVVLKESVQAKVGVTLTRQVSDPRPVFVKIATDGAAAAPACQLQGVVMPGDRLISVRGYTNVVHFVTVSHGTQGTSVATAAMLSTAVGVVTFTIERGGKKMQATTVKQSAADRIGIKLESHPGDKHPTVIEVGEGSKAAGKLEVGDVILAVTSATKEETIDEAATAAQPALAVVWAGKFLRSALGPVTLVVERVSDKKARRASVAALAANARDLHEVDEHEVIMSTVAAADVDADGDGILSRAELASVGLGANQLDAGSKHA